jgi:hypothetical protein
MDGGGPTVAAVAPGRNRHAGPRPGRSGLDRVRALRVPVELSSVQTADGRVPRVRRRPVRAERPGSRFGGRSLPGRFGSRRASTDGGRGQSGAERVQNVLRPERRTPPNPKPAARVCHAKCPAPTVLVPRPLRVAADVRPGFPPIRRSGGAGGARSSYGLPDQRRPAAHVVPPQFSQVGSVASARAGSRCRSSHTCRRLWEGLPAVRFTISSSRLGVTGIEPVTSACETWDASARVVNVGQTGFVTRFRSDRRYSSG